MPDDAALLDALKQVVDPELMINIVPSWSLFVKEEFGHKGRHLLLIYVNSLCCRM